MTDTTEVKLLKDTNERFRKRIESAISSLRLLKAKSPATSNEISKVIYDLTWPSR